MVPACKAPPNVPCPAQIRSPVELVSVQPVEALPPPKRMFPVEVPPTLTVPVVPALIVKSVAAVETAIA